MQQRLRLLWAGFSTLYVPHLSDFNLDQLFATCFSCLILQKVKAFIIYSTLLALLGLRLSIGEGRISFSTGATMMMLYFLCR